MMRKGHLKNRPTGNMGNAALAEQNLPRQGQCTFRIPGVVEAKKEGELLPSFEQATELGLGRIQQGCFWHVALRAG